MSSVLPVGPLGYQLLRRMSISLILATVVSSRVVNGKLMKKKFTESTHCTTHVHCVACRGDEGFRKSLIQAFDWDGECPYGFTLDNLPKKSKSPSMPPMRQQVRNLTEAVGRAVKAFATGEQVIANEELRKERISICEECNQLSGTRCAKCGCYTNKKIILQTEKCPIGRW